MRYLTSSDTRRIRWVAVGHLEELIWLSASDASYYLDDWLTGMLLDFLDTTEFTDEETVELVYEASNHCLPLFNVPL